MTRTADHRPARDARVPQPHRPAGCPTLCRTTRPCPLFASGRSFVTEPRQPGADVRSLTDTLIAHAQSAGGQLTSAQLARTVETAEVTPAQAKKILRALSEAGVTVVVDGS